MKICFCGLGSIGQRHIRNLSKIATEFGIDPVFSALRSTDRDLPNDVISLLDSQTGDVGALDDYYDIIFVTNPTVCHFDVLRKLAGRAGAFFIEKPLFESSSRRLEEVCWKDDPIYYVACPLRYSGVIQHLKMNLPWGISSVRSICSSYLPEWRPDIDYRRNYSAIRDMGGGVVLDLIHEWDYLKYLFGSPVRISFMNGHYSGMDFDSDDLAVYIAAYRKFLTEVHLDYVGRVPRRQIEIFTDDDVIVGDLLRSRITWQRSGKVLDFEGEDSCYLSEMRYFLSHVISGEKTHNEYDVAYNTLRLVEGMI